MSNQQLPATVLEKQITYKAGAEEVALTRGMVRQFLVKPTRSGAEPGEADIVKFMLLCKGQRLNPWLGDAFLVGYDSKSGPEFSMITSHASLLKRADANDAYDGLKSGVIVKGSDGEIAEMTGKFRLDDDILLGAWAEVLVKDKEFSRKKVRIQAYEKENKFWKRDREGMIVKCAEAAALREAFPNILQGAYIAEEMMQAVDVSGSVDIGPSPSESRPAPVAPKLGAGKAMEKPKTAKKQTKPRTKKPEPEQTPEPPAEEPTTHPFAGDPAEPTPERGDAYEEPVEEELKGLDVPE